MALIWQLPAAVAAGIYYTADKKKRQALPAVSPDRGSYRKWTA
jgi:hypothetical protein